MMTLSFRLISLLENTESTINDFSALIGIDWADKKHDICEMPAATSDYQFSVISSKPQALHDWALSLKQRYPGKPVAHPTRRKLFFVMTNELILQQSCC